MIELIKGTPIKGPIHNYDPHNFDDVYADEYGGYGTGMNGSNARNSRFNDRGANNTRFNNRNSNNSGSKDRGRRFDFVDPWAHNGGNNANSSSSFGAMPSLTSLMGNGGGFGNINNNNNNNNDMDGKSSTQVTIPKDVNFLIS